MVYQGACHCSAVQFEAEGEVAKVLVECNCSYCSKRGTLLWFTAKSGFRWKVGEGKTGIYHFNKHVIDHHFCPECGCSHSLSARIRRAMRWRPSTCAVWTMSISRLCRVMLMMVARFEMRVSIRD